jgi:creatinine amidohydrolase
MHVWIHEGPRYPQVAKWLAQQGHGSHADELETSLMLALAPDLVDMARAEASPAVIKDTPGALTPSDPASPNYSRSGSYGDPTLATSAKGETLLAAILDDLNEHVAAFVAKASAAGQGSGTSRSSLQ